MHRKTTPVHISGWTLQSPPVYTQRVRRLLADRLLPLRTFVVQDTSMRPALQPGDRLMVGAWLRPSRGALVVLQDPERHSIFLVKRAAHIQPDGALVVLADNPNVSRDSRHFGPVPRQLYVGRVFF